MRIAVVGAGYAGLALCWNLLQIPGIEISLFDAQGVGGGASGVSTGLLHPYLAKKALFAHRGAEAMKEADALLEIAEEALGQKVVLRNGVFRFAVSPEQQREFCQRAEYWDQKKTGQFIVGASPLPGLWIPQGKTVFSRRYLKGLWLACEGRKATFYQQKISDLKELSEYDRVVLASGYEILSFEECKQLPLKVRNGQAILCRWPEALPLLPCSIVGNGHISLTEDPSVCQIGSTYEDQFDPAQLAVLLEKVALFFPPVRSMELLEVRAGVRISQIHSTRPFLGQIDSRTWVFTGLGSRGLLYHALFAKDLVQQMMRG